MRKGAFRYAGGKIEPFEDGFWPEGIENYEDALRELGFSPHDIVRLDGLDEEDDDFCGSMLVHATDAKEDLAGRCGSRFLVAVWNGDSCWARIHVDDFGDLLQVAWLIEPLRVFWSSPDATLKRMLKLASKMFEAWHGHSAADPCHECDALEYQIRIDRRERMRRARQEKEKAAAPGKAQP